MSSKQLEVCSVNSVMGLENQMFAFVVGIGGMGWDKMDLTWPRSVLCLKGKTDWLESRCIQL